MGKWQQECTVNKYGSYSLKILPETIFMHKIINVGIDLGKNVNSNDFVLRVN